MAVGGRQSVTQCVQPRTENMLMPGLKLEAGMITNSTRVVVAYSCAGHFALHVLLGLYLTLVLVIEQVWKKPYEELVALWTLGALLVGIGAPVAGWLSDRWGERRLMLVFFFAAGGASVLAGLSKTTDMLWISLALLGLAASIYHPVALSWVVKHTRRSGQVMGFWGLCGSIGVATASVIAGALADVWNWQLAFILPGACTLALGVALWLTPTPEGRSSAAVEADEADAVIDRRTLIQAFVALTGAMACTAVFYHSLTTMMPKWLGETVFPPELGGDGAGISILGVGTVVTLVYLFGSAAQVAGGWLADRMPLKLLFIWTYVVKLPLPLVAAALGGWPAFVVAAAIVFLMEIGAPVENILVARYSPPGRRGLVYGLKFVLAFAAAPVGVQLVAWCYGLTESFSALWHIMAGLIFGALVAVFCLPADRRPKVVAAAA